MPWIAGLPRPPLPRASRSLPAPICQADRAQLRSNLGNPQVDSLDRTYLAQLVTQQIGMPKLTARRRIDEAFAEFKVAQQKARDAADKARKARSPTSWRLLRWRSGARQPVPEALEARHRDERTTLTLFGARRFW
jgi:hypothetical protein